MVDRIALCEVAAVFEKLRAGAPISKEVWMVDTPLGASPYEDLDSFYQDFYTLSRLKHTRSFLFTLQTSLQNAIEYLGAGIIPQARLFGLQCLPDTLLSEVFDELCSDFAEKDSASFQGQSKVVKLRRDLALVSRRFRHVAHTTPSLWAFANSWDSETVIESSLKLSRALPLHLTFQINGSRPEYQLMLMRALTHIDRWKSLCFREIGITRWAHIRTVLAGAPFSSITSLRFTEFCPQGFLDEHTFPALRELDIVYLIPPAHIVARLTSLTISHLCAEQGKPIEYLLKALGYARKLEKLEITLEPNDFLDVVYRAEVCAEPRVVTLPILASLSVKALDWARRLDAQLFRSMAWFTRALRTPSLTSVALEVSCYNVGFIPSDLKYFPPDCILDTVRNADLKIGLTNYDFRLDDPEEVVAFDGMAQRTRAYIRAVLSRIPAVDNLALQVPGFVMGIDYTPFCPNLRRLYLRGPHAIGAVELHRFIERARRGEVALESMTIVTVAVDSARTFYAGETRDVVIMEGKAGTMDITWKEVERQGERTKNHSIAVLARSA